MPVADQIRKGFVGEVTKAPGGGDRCRRFCVSTASVDRDNDVIEVAGWKLDNYKKNPQILFGHDYSALPIGKCVSIGIEGNKLIAVAEFATADMNPLAEQVLRLIDGGFLRATSVGFRPIKYTINSARGGLDFTECELLEFSVVPVPANPEALMVSRSLGCTEDSKGARSRLIARLGGGEVVLEFDVDDEDDAVIELDLAPCAEAAVKAANDRARLRRSEPFEPIITDMSRDELQGLVTNVMRESLRTTLKESVERALRLAAGRVD